jgi:ribosome biogenesis GTPase
MSGRRLSERQQRRIRSIQERRRQRLAARVDEALSHADPQGPQEGRVITRHGSNLVVQDRRDELIHCLFRQNL